MFIFNESRSVKFLLLLYGIRGLGCLRCSAKLSLDMRFMSLRPQRFFA